MSRWEEVLSLGKEEYVLGNWRIELKKGGKKMFKGEAFDRVVLTNRMHAETQRSYSRLVFILNNIFYSNACTQVYKQL